MNGKKWQMNLQQPLNKILIWLSFMVIFILIGCEEKVPEYVLEDSPVEFMKIDLGPESIIEDTTIEVDASLGGSYYLFIGDDENINSYALLRFSDFLDDVDADSILSLKLVLYTSSLWADTTQDSLPFILSVIKGEGSWGEDSTCYDNFSLEESDYERIDTVFAGSSDTIYIELEDSLYTYWRDGSNNGLALLPLDSSEGTMITMYSSESGNTKPKLFVEYINDGDTLSHVHYCSEDISILKFKRDFKRRGILSLSRGLGYRTYILIGLPDSIKDSDIVAKCELKLNIDSSKTVNYGGYFSFYTAYVDTGMWLDSGELSGISNAKLTSVGKSDSVIVVDLKQITQNVIEKKDSLRLVMWVSPYTPDVSVLSIFNAKSEFAQLRPSVELIIMREK